MRNSKPIFRALYKKNIPPLGSREALSMQLCEHLAQEEALQKAMTIGTFSARPHEPSIDGLWKFFPEKLAFPKVGGSSMVFYSVAKIEQLRPGYQGILEPEENQKNVALFCQGDVILVPGISFDANGRRLGSGLGFYDRFLANLNPEVLKIGVAWQSQISPTRLPEETHDVRMDCFCTETGFFRAKI